MCCAVGKSAFRPLPIHRQSWRGIWWIKLKVRIPFFSSELLKFKRDCSGLLIRFLVEDLRQYSDVITRCQIYVFQNMTIIPSTQIRDELSGWVDGGGGCVLVVAKAAKLPLPRPEHLLRLHPPISSLICGD